jgi:hypothetical protein
MMEARLPLTEASMLGVEVVGLSFGNSGVRGPAIRLARDIALTLVTRMKSLRTLLVELKQLRAEIGYILGWIGTVLAALILIASAILYLA